MSEQRYPIDRGDYFELRTVDLEMKQAAGALKLLRERQAALLAALGKTHGFDPVGDFRLEDEGCVLVAPQKPI